MLNRKLEKLSLRLALPLVIATLTAGCVPRKKADSSLKDLVFDQNAPNIALLFGASNGLAGVDTDLRELKALLENPQYRFGFKVIVQSEATAEQMVNMTQQYAAAVGNNGTLLWYWSGHGAEGSGCMATNSSCTSFKPMAQAIQQARTSPIKRFFFFADSCFSGQLVVGNNSILTGGTSSSLFGGNESSYSSLGDPIVKTYTDRAADDVNGSLIAAQDQNRANSVPGMFEQALTMSAARMDETSADLGASQGGAFTLSLRRTLTSLANQPNATIRDLVTQTTATTSSEFQHTPSYRTIPGDVVLNDKLFGGDMASGQGGGTPPATGAAMTGLFAKMGPQQTTGASYVYVSSPNTAASVGLCRGNLAQCKVNPTAAVQFATITSTVPGMALFRSTAPVTWINGETIFVFSKSAQGQVTWGSSLQTRMK